MPSRPCKYTLSQRSSPNDPSPLPPIYPTSLPASPQFDVDDVKQGTTNMMDILNIVGLVRTGMDKLGVDIDAVIIVVNNAFALVNIMNAVRLTELKAKTITSSSIFEPNPSLMMSSSIAGLVVPVFFNPDDVNRGLSGGRYMGTAVEFKQRIDENYKCVDERDGAWLVVVVCIIVVFVVMVM